MDPLEHRLFFPFHENVLDMNGFQFPPKKEHVQYSSVTFSIVTIEVSF